MIKDTHYHRVGAASSLKKLGYVAVVGVFAVVGIVAYAGQQENQASPVKAEQILV